MKWLLMLVGTLLMIAACGLCDASLARPRALWGVILAALAGELIAYAWWGK